jgi:hypothetical protein
MAAPNLKYMVSGAGFPVSKPQSMLIPVGTVVDTSQPQWAFLAGMAPVDAIALDQQTYNYMTSTGGVSGLYLDPNRVGCGPGVVSAAVDKDVGDYWNKPNHREPGFKPPG